jgi:hypothetical protein
MALQFARLFARDGRLRNPPLLQVLVGNASRTEADEIISDTIAPPLDSTTAAIKVAPKGRRSISKVYKKPVRANKRRKKH